MATNSALRVGGGLPPGTANDVLRYDAANGWEATTSFQLDGVNSVASGTTSFLIDGLTLGGLDSGSNNGIRLDGFDPNVSGFYGYYNGNYAFGLDRWKASNLTRLTYGVNDALVFQKADGNEIARMDTSGDMGIGGVSAGYRLDVISDAIAYQRLRTTATDGVIQHYFYNPGTAGTAFMYWQSDVNIGGAIGYYHSVGALVFHADNNTEKMRLNATGLGVFVDPRQTLHAYSSNAQVALMQANSTNAWVNFRNTSIASDTTHRIGFLGADFVVQNSGVSNFRVADTGNVGINVTTPQYRLDVNGQSRFGTLTPVSTALISCVSTTNSLEWGHSNPNGYRSTLGAWSGSGLPFIGFNCEHGTNANSWRTRGIRGTLFYTNTGGDFQLAKIADPNADNQGSTFYHTFYRTGEIGINNGTPAVALDVESGDNNNITGTSTVSIFRKANGNDAALVVRASYGAAIVDRTAILQAYSNIANGDGSSGNPVELKLNPAGGIVTAGADVTASYKVEISGEYGSVITQSPVSSSTSVNGYWLDPQFSSGRTCFNYLQENGFSGQGQYVRSFITGRRPGSISNGNSVESWFDPAPSGLALSLLDKQNVPVVKATHIDNYLIDYTGGDGHTFVAGAHVSSLHPLYAALKASAIAKSVDAGIEIADAFPAGVDTGGGGLPAGVNKIDLVQLMKNIVDALP